jgi:hypothetical protein
MANAVSHKQSINHELARNSSYVKRPRKSRPAQEGPASQDGTGGGAIWLDSPATGLEISPPPADALCVRAVRSMPIIVMSKIES